MLKNKKVWVMTIMVIVCVLVGIFIFGGNSADYSVDTLATAMGEGKDVVGKTVEFEVTKTTEHPMIGHGYYTNTDSVMFISREGVKAKAGDTVTFTVTSYNQMLGV